MYPDTDDLDMLRESEEILKRKADKLKSECDAKQAELEGLIKRTSLTHNISTETLLEHSRQKVKVEKVQNVEAFEDGKRTLLTMNEDLKRQKDLEKAQQEKEAAYQRSLLEIKKLQNKMELERRELEECKNQLDTSRHLINKKIQNFSQNSSNTSTALETSNTISSTVTKKGFKQTETFSSSENYSTDYSDDFSDSEDNGLGHSSSYYRYEKTVTTSGAGKKIQNTKPTKKTVKNKTEKMNNSLNLNSCSVAVLAGKCKGLRKPNNVLGVVKPYIVVIVNDMKRKTAFNEEGSLEPAFKEKFIFKGVNLEKDRVIVEVRNKVLIQRQRFGVSSLKFSEIFELDKLDAGKNEVTKVISLDGEGNGKVMLKFICFVQTK